MRISSRLIIASLFFYSGFSFAESRPTDRSDLEKGSPIFCEESKDDLASLGLYDAQIELAFVKTQGLKPFAEEFARTNSHRGYSYGTCKDGRQWIVSTPAPLGVLEFDRAKNLVSINYLELAKSCQSFDVDAILEGQEQPVSLVRDEVPRKRFDRVDLQDSKPRTVTLTCHPKDKSKTGPELWGLIPLMPTEKVTGLKSEADLLEWIQGLRKKSGIPRLEIGAKSLQAVADESALQKDLHHPHALLLTRKAELKSQKLELLGENRAVAPSFSGLAELLWNSPTHRRLLLNPKANAIALNTSQKGDEKLLVMVLAKQ